MQVLGMLALMLRRTDLSERRRVALVWCGIGGYTGVLVAVSLQTAGGTAPLQVSAATVAAVIAAAVVAGAYAVALLGRRRVIRA
jgi:NhaP-type Na+/H+ or K+/H+ antiporter